MSMKDIAALYNNPTDIQRTLALRVKEQRRARHISQKQLSEKSGVSYASIRRFENSGEISFSSFVKIICSLGLSDEIKNLFTKKYYSSIQEIIDEESRKY